MRSLKNAVILLSALTASGLPLSALAEGPVADSEDAPMRVVLVPAREAKISSAMEGRVLEVPLQEGMSFNRGDVLARFDCSTRSAERAIAEARHEKARLRHQSQQQLQLLDAVSDLDVQLAAADLLEAEAVLALAKVDEQRCVIRAPYNGRIVKAVVNQFEILSANAGMFQIVSTEKLRAELLVPSNWLTWLEHGQALEITVKELGITAPA